MPLFVAKISIHRIGLTKPKEAVWQNIVSLGGENGWLGTDHLWKLRGAFDRLLGGDGFNKGRPRGRPIKEGDRLDFWLVSDIDPANFRLTLKAQMRLPGFAYLDWYFEEDERGDYLVQRSRFYPLSWWGKFYWYSVLPAHRWVFGYMAKRLAKS